ncbi:cytosine permease [Pediococcus pentosaceus]|uniref:Cytosine permease n=1 Tax=Pediococcus pentosaceus TaxID=1255 RepID=A0A6L5A0H8_PEDPE|nr:cytosine permease [Pediococcus pentosaceus]KAF0351263.1 cytosine permease [Pediococcus pentosaceus]KAF0413333.1 cytosine permease [Pediococcus pentosaceus]KAF0503648.1 cytosine permease [Pediococcus pentosaceus]MBF7106321.1 cytosine permease [Pediococcus pentosaceus]MBF7127583.1 cytosine permease [Pediococcus pentosaceus]
MNTKYQVESIDKKHRHMTYWDMFATWVGANANNGTWFIGGIIAACGFWGGIKALILASSISYIFLMLVGYMGTKTGVTTMALSRASFGIRGSIIPSIVNLTQFVGWTAVNTFIAATSVSYILHSFLGWPVYGQPGGNLGLIMGIAVMSILHLISIVSGQKSIQIIERIGIILVIIFVIWESIVVFKDVSFIQIAAWKVPSHLKMGFGTAMDTLAAFNLAWVTAGADFTRFTKKSVTATTAPFLGANLGVFGFAFIGLSATISIAISSGVYDPNNSDPSTIANRLGLGLIAMIVIMLTSMTANAVNIQAAGSALNNMFTKLTLKQSLLITTVIATLVTFIPVFYGSFLETFTAFLDYVGMVLGPIISIMVVDYFLISKQKYDPMELGNPNGRYWYKNGIHWTAFILWLVGVIFYSLLQKLDFVQTYTGATFIVMIIIGILYWLIMQFEKRNSNVN